MRYVPALDGLRGLAVMLVFLYHVSRHFPGGWIGVDIFFVLSGFLITSILLEERGRKGAISLSRFYMRRACRLLPALVTVVCVTGVLAVWLHSRTRDTEIDAAAALLYLADYRYAFMPVDGTTPLTHTWSLSVEEQFYLIWPLLLIALLRFSRGMAFRATLALIIIVGIWRGFLLFSYAHPLARTYFAFDTRADELLIGCALAIWRPQLATVRLPRYLWPVMLLGLATVALKVGLSEQTLRYMGTVGYPLVGIAVANLILIATNTEKSLLTYALSRRPVVALGRISYGFYLWHFPIVHLIPGRKIEAFLFTLAVAVVSYRLIERPFLRFAHSGSMSLRLHRPSFLSRPVVTEGG
jgi:peptidoglycan/LPS O-acetylase OafA/YrhL